MLRLFLAGNPLVIQALGQAIGEGLQAPKYQGKVKHRLLDTTKVEENVSLAEALDQEPLKPGDTVGLITMFGGTGGRNGLNELYEQWDPARPYLNNAKAVYLASELMKDEGREITRDPRELNWIPKDSSRSFFEQVLLHSYDINRGDPSPSVVPDKSIFKYYDAVDDNDDLRKPTECIFTFIDELLRREAQ